jgi:hypothetical protein
LVASVVLITFNLLHGIWSNVVLEIALVLINIARLTRHRDDKRHDRATPSRVIHNAIPPVYERQPG